MAKQKWPTPAEIRREMAAAEAKYGNPNQSAGPDSPNQSWIPGEGWQPDNPAPSPERKDEDPGGGGGGGAPPPRVVSTFTRRALGGKVQTIRVWSDGREDVISEYIDKSAGEAAADMFRNVGLNDDFIQKLMASIDQVYATNLDPSPSQILNVIYNSEAYKDRFKANVTIAERLKSGQGRPGDRQLTPKEYIDLENSYRDLLQSRGMPENFYDSPDDFTNLIANSISVNEFASRVDTASNALQRADQKIVNALQQYYGLSKGDLVAYLLDPTKAEPILNSRQLRGGFGLNSAGELNRIYDVAQVGGMAGRASLDLERGLAEEIVDLDKKDQAEGAISTAAAADPDLRRLGSLYGGALDFRDLLKETLSLTGGIESGKRRRKFASKERAAFSAQGALDSKSLRRMQDV